MEGTKTESQSHLKWQAIATVCTSTVHLPLLTSIIKKDVKFLLYELPNKKKKRYM